MTLEERVISWREAAVQQGVEQGLRQGREQGIRQGGEEGIDRERTLLRRLAAERFGADTAERVFALLAREEDPQRLTRSAWRSCVPKRATSFSSRPGGLSRTRTAPPG